MMSSGMMGAVVRAAAAGSTIVPALTAALGRTMAGITDITAGGAFPVDAVFIMFVQAV